MASTSATPAASATAVIASTGSRDAGAVPPAPVSTPPNGTEEPALASARTSTVRPPFLPSSTRIE